MRLHLVEAPRKKFNLSVPKSVFKAFLEHDGAIWAREGESGYRDALVTHFLSKYGTMPRFPTQTIVMFPRFRTIH